MLHRIYLTSLKQFCGVFCVSIIALTTLSQCNKKKLQTPPWEKNHTAPTTTQTPESKSVTPPPSTPAASLHPLHTPVRFVAYNVRNYLTMRRGKHDAPKPQHEIEDLIKNILRAKPDILGICEIGDINDLRDLQMRLKNKGCDLPYSHLATATDPYRHLAILSKSPIIIHRPPQRTYRIKNERFQIRRGILDVSINTDIGELRFLGAHLKSKRSIKGYDQALIRRNEAMLLRRHAATLLKNPNIKLLVYGDMNDTKRSAAIRTIQGPHQGRQALKPIDLRATNGTKWTQYWAAEDIYSRFDFVFTSPSLLPHIDTTHSSILEVPRTNRASDHRALIVVIK